MTLHDMALILAYSQVSNKDSFLQNKWKNEEAREIARQFEE